MNMMKTRLKYFAFFLICILAFAFILRWQPFVMRVGVPEALRESTDESLGKLYWYLCASKNWETRGGGTEPMDAGAHDIPDHSLLSHDIRRFYDSGGDYTVAFAYDRQKEGMEIASVSAKNKYVKIPLSRNPSSWHWIAKKDTEPASDWRKEYTFDSAIMLDLSDDVWVYIYETAPCRARQGTVAVINRLADIVKVLNENMESVYDELISDGSMKTMTDGKENVRITEVEYSGLSFSGYINTGERGYVTLAAYDNQNNPLPLDDDPKFFPAWSDNFSEYFYFQTGSAWVLGNGKMKDIRLDLDFTSVSGAKSTLYSTNCVVRTVRKY